jgi:hypothetical protein
MAEYRERWAAPRSTGRRNSSKEEQRQRFLARVDEGDKNGRFSAADARERQYWEVVPADRTRCARICEAANIA